MINASRSRQRTGGSVGRLRACSLERLDRYGVSGANISGCREDEGLRMDQLDTLAEKAKKLDSQLTESELKTLSRVLKNDTPRDQTQTALKTLRAVVDWQFCSLSSAGVATDSISTVTTYVSDSDPDIREAAGHILKKLATEQPPTHQPKLDLTQIGRRPRFLES